MSIVVRPFRRGGWEVDIRLALPDDSEHRERRRAPFASKTACQRWAQDRARELYQQLTHPDEQPKKEAPTIRQFASRFLDEHARAERQKASGIAAKEMILRVHITPFVGALRLDEITNASIQQLKLSLRSKAPKTVNNILTVLNTMLRKAVEWGVIEKMPCTIRLLRVPKRAMKFYDFEEYERLVAAAKQIDHQSYVTVLLGGDGGLRCGEMVALEQTDIDFHKGKVCVERSAWKGQIGMPKGGRLRYVPLTVRLKVALLEARHLRGPRVLYQLNGEPLTEKVVQRLVGRAARKAGLANNGPHILRHTFCSHLAMRGAPLVAIQELAGHQDIRTTIRYAHLSPSAVDAAIRLLESSPVPQSFGDGLETGEASISKSSV